MTRGERILVEQTMFSGFIFYEIILQAAGQEEISQLLLQRVEKLPAYSQLRCGLRTAIPGNLCGNRFPGIIIEPVGYGDWS